MRSYDSEDDVLTIKKVVDGRGCCSFSEGFCVTWALFMYVFQFIITTVDTGFGGVALAQFRSHMSQELSEDEEMKPYLNTWTAGYVLTTFVCLSDLSLLIYVFRILCRDSRYKTYTNAKNIIFIWTKANFVLEFICEDGMVSLGRILLAFKSEEAENQLRSGEERVASIVTFAASLLQLLLIIIPMIVNLAHYHKCCTRSLCYDMFCLFTGCVAVSTSGLSMLISLSKYNIYQEDPADFAFNIMIILVSTGLLFIFCSVIALCVGRRRCCCAPKDKRMFV